MKKENHFKDFENAFIKIKSKVQSSKKKKFVIDDVGYIKWKQVNSNWIEEKRKTYKLYSLEEFELNLHIFYLQQVNINLEKKMIHSRKELLSGSILDLNQLTRNLVLKYSAIRINRFVKEYDNALRRKRGKHNYLSNYLIAKAFIAAEHQYIKKSLFIQELFSVTINRIDELNKEIQTDLYEKTVNRVKTEPFDWKLLIPFYKYIGNRFKDCRKVNGKFIDIKIILHIRKIAGMKNVSKFAIQTALTRYKKNKGLIPIRN